MSILSRRALLGAASAISSSASASSAEKAWPTRPLRLVVPFQTGGTMDTVIRLFAPAAAQNLGQPIVIENRAGAAGAIGTAEVARAAPDGYTLLATGSSYTVVPLLQRNLTFSLSDLAPVTRLSSSPVVLVVPFSLPVRSLAEFVALAKSKPGELAFASTGIGTTAHLVTEIIQRSAGIELVHVPYRGPALPDLLAARLQLMLPTLVEVQDLLAEGRLRALAVGYDTRLDLLPDVPTLGELGYPGIPASANIGIVVPAATPLAIRTRIEAAFRAAGRAPQVRQRLEENGIIPIASSSADYAELLGREQARFAEVIQQANITLN
ncbi:MAG: tripartite tricarboxylate transporter substrate binding protein [Rubritepida sp.]|nr:tripartite tricarboxylate transporter substrate binding protein [Rubritepida sp.]